MNPATLKTRRCFLLWGTSLVCFGSLCLAGKSIANPNGETVRLGSAEFIRQGDNLLIRQDSQNLIVDWKGFSIAKGELTKFLQPGSDSAALNRVFSGNPSEIYGSLQSNGKVYLINPNGVFIGPSGRIDAGSFVASTLDISDEEFLKGGDLTFSGNSEASIVNLGTVNALDGDAFLIAKTVENYGTINAPNGTAGLAAGTEVILQPAGDEKIGVSIASGAGKVVNTGKIAAAQAELKAAGGNLYALAIQNSGSVRATGVERKAGRVFLRANAGKIDNSGSVEATNANGSGGRIVVGPGRKSDGAPGSLTGVGVSNSGVLDASGSSGGDVTVSAEDVVLAESSRVLATGAAGSGGNVSVNASNRITGMSGSLANVTGTTGGSVEYAAGVGIDLSGALVARGETGSGGIIELPAPSVTTHAATLDASGSTGGSIQVTGGDIIVDGTTRLVADGNLWGGTVVAVADNGMEFHGNIFARAAAENGLGGTAEVSGLTSLDYDGNADLRSSRGTAGTLTLDPTNFTITAGVATVITTNLQTSNVVISTASSGSGAGDILVNAPVLYSSANSLSLLAHRNIDGDASIQNGGSGALNLVAGWDGVTGLGGASIDFATFTGKPSSFGNNGGSIFIGGGNGDAVAIGSRTGATNAAGFGIVITGGRGNSASAQLGFRASDTIGGIGANGPIQLELKDDLTVAGGNGNFAYAQIGHAGDGSSGGLNGTNFQGSISIKTPGDVQITGGVNFSYAQIGHGGDGSSGSQSGSISIQANDLSLIGGSKPNAYAQIGHGDASGTASGTRTGTIDIRATGETSLLNGPGNNAVWLIGHGTSTPSGVSGADILFSTSALDYSLGAIANRTTLSQDFVDKFGRNLSGGNVTIRSTGSGNLIVDGGFHYNSSNRLTLTADSSATLNAPVTNAGSGEIVLVIDAANSIRPNSSPTASLTIASTATLASGGAIRIFAVNPNNTHLGGFTPAARRYNVWFGDPLAVAGVNYKFQPTLTLSADSFTKSYGQTVTFDGNEFAYTGLQPGDSLSQILSGNPGLSSPGGAAVATVAGSPYSITFDAGLTAGSGYALQLVNGSLSVTPAGLSITANNQSKVYGNGFTFGGTEFTSAGLLNSDSISAVSLTSAGTQATAGVAGSPYVINAANATGGGLGNYTITYLPGELTVTPAPLSLRALDGSKIYGSTLVFAGTEFSATGLKNGESVGLVNLASTGTVATAGVAGSPYGIAISNARGGNFDPANYTLNYVQGSLGVTPAGLSITANNQSKVYGNGFTFGGTEFTSAGLLNSDSISTVNLTSAGTLATAGVAGSPYVINAANATGSGLGNYTITYLPGELTVTPAPLSLRALDGSKIYGSTLAFAGTEFSATGLKNGESVGLVNLASTGAVATAGVAGSPYGIAISNARGGTFDPANYTLSYVGGSLAVTPATLRITANNQSKVYGNGFAFGGTEFTSAGLLNSDSISTVNLTSAGTLATAGVAGSPYVINAANATGSGLGNYTITYLPGELTVTPAPLSLRALDGSKIYGSTLAFAGTEFSATGLKNGESVGLVNLASTGAVATAGVAGSPYGIAISNARGGTFDPANYTLSYVQGSLGVTPAGLSITANNQSKEYGNGFAFGGTEFTSAGLLNSDSISTVSLTSAGTLATAGVAGSPYVINAANATGGGLGNYTITYLPGELTVTPAPLSLRALDGSKIYGSTLVFAGTEFSATGLKNGESVGLVNLASTGTVATAGVAGSPYGIAISNARGGTFDPANYTLNYVQGSLGVTPAGLSITANNQSKVYGNGFTFGGTEFTSAGLLNSDSISTVNLTSAGTLATAGVAGSPYVINAANATGGGLGNYTITYLPGELTVTPAPLSLRALDGSKIYGSTLAFAGTEFSATGLKNGESVGLVNLASTGAVATAGVAGSSLRDRHQ